MLQKELIVSSSVEVYEQVLQGKLKTFPSGFWINRTREEGEKVAVELLKHLIETRFKWTREEIITNISKDFIRDNKLWTPFKLYFGRAVNHYCMAAYPGRFMPFEFENCKVGQRYWTNETNRINALKWLFNVKLGWSLDDIKEKFNLIILYDNGLATLRRFYPSLFELVNVVYPSKIQPWELQQAEVPNGTWKDRNNRIKAVRWLIEILGWSHEDLVARIDGSIFSKYGLGELLEKYYSGNPVKALLDALPDEYFPWEFRNRPLNTWDKETGIKATRWLLIERLKFSREDIIKNTSWELFEKYGLRGMLEKLYNGSASLAVADAFGDSIRVWELPVTPKRYWNKDTAAESVRWLIDETLGWDDSRINEQLSKKIFREFGLERMLRCCYNGSPYLAIKDTYPDGNWEKLKNRYQ